jgi:thiosulfate dehydrogenase
MDQIGNLARKLGWLFTLFFVLVLILFIGVVTYQPSSEVRVIQPVMVAQLEWAPKDILKIWETTDPLVRKGYQILSQSSTNIGPNASNPEDRFAGNNLSCTNCHLKGGTQAGSGSWVGVASRFPQFGGRSNKIGTLEDRINGCMERSMNGRKIPVTSDAMKAMIAYMEWLGEDLPAGKESYYKGYAPIKLPQRAVNLEAGSIVYSKECALCHGQEGMGIPGPENGYLYPPLWGPDSFNDGAGMHRVITAAEFIRGNMPFGMATRDNPKLTDEEAYDVAGYINSFERPHKKGSENDYPDLTLKPVSTSYGPWVDDFSASEHKFGPFQPIMAFYKSKYNLDKAK